jgi:hypothetical protein
MKEMLMAASRIVPIANTTLADYKSLAMRRESVAAILERCKAPLIAAWLARSRKTPQLYRLHLDDEGRTGHLPRLIDDIVARLGRVKLPGSNSDAIGSIAAMDHGTLRQKQGYSSAMLVQESRILQVVIFGTLQKNASVLDFSLLLPDVVIIADEVDNQLSQTMESFMKEESAKSTAYQLKPTG